MKRNSAYILLLSVVCIFTFFVNNRTIYPDIMESRNIVTAREMVYDGHWMVPTMNGDLRLEKPPLPTWIAAGAELLSPGDIGMQRAMSGIAATMLILFFYFLGKKITRNDDFAWIASLILCTSYNIVLMGRTASWDIYCHAFMLGAIYFIYCTFKEKQRSWTSAVCGGIFLGLSFMSKGPVSFYGLLLPFVIVFLLYGRPLQKNRWKQLLVMIFICLIISSWWYIYIYIFHTEASRYVLNKESTAWTDRNVRPWYYYSTFFLEMGVWALMLLTAIIFPFWTKRLKLRREYLFVLAWMLLQLLLLSLFPEKKKRYLLPVLIPASYLVAFIFTYWHRCMLRRTDKWSARFYSINTYLISLVCLAVPIAAYWLAYKPGYLTFDHYLAISILILIIAGWLLLVSWKREPFSFVYGVVALFMVTEIMLMPYIGDLANNTEFKSVSETKQIKVLDHIPFYYVKGKEMRIEIIYEAHRKIRPIDVNDSTAVMNALPMAIFTHGKVRDELPVRLMGKIKARWIGRYDNNQRPKNTRRYSDMFIYNITLLTKK